VPDSPRRRVDPEAVRGMHEDGKDSVQMAAALGVAASTVRWWCRRLGLALGRRPSNLGADLAGSRFGRLVVVERDGSNKYAAALWRCECDCGEEHTTTANRLLRLVSPTRSCGCLKREHQRAAKPALAAASRRTRRHAWKKTCPTCGVVFRGTARQVYDRPECRLEAATHAN
jgi:hypothetical protein